MNDKSCLTNGGQENLLEGKNEKNEINKNPSRGPRSLEAQKPRSHKSRKLMEKLMIKEICWI